MIGIGLWCVHGYKGVPGYLGGTGTCRDVGFEWPTPNFNSGMRIYSFVQHGYHLQSKFLLSPLRLTSFKGTIIHLVTKRN
jgi:hypothetical protein